MDNIKKYFSDLFQLSPEVLMDLPLLMVVGQRKIYVENHKGLALYNDDKIKIRIKEGYLLFSGQRLVIKEIQSDSLLVSGRIEGISYEY